MKNYKLTLNIKMDISSNRIELIRFFRYAFGLSLKEAKSGLSDPICNHIGFLNANPNDHIPVVFEITAEQLGLFYATHNFGDTTGVEFSIYVVDLEPIKPHNPDKLFFNLVPKQPF